MCVQVAGPGRGAGNAFTTMVPYQDPRAPVGVGSQQDQHTFMMFQQFQQFMNMQNMQNQNQRQGHINITYPARKRRSLADGMDPEKSPPSAGTPRAELDSQDVEEQDPEETPTPPARRTPPPVEQPQLPPPFEPKKTPDEGQPTGATAGGPTLAVAVYDPAKASKRILEAMGERAIKRKQQKAEEERQNESEPPKEAPVKGNTPAGSKAKAKAKQTTKKTEVEAKKHAKGKGKGSAKGKKADTRIAEETTEVKQEEPETTGDESSRRQYTRKWYNGRHKMAIVKGSKQLCQFGNVNVEKDKLVEIATKAIDRLADGSLVEWDLKLWCEEELAKCAT